MSSFTPCNWKYRTTAGLTMGCVLELDHLGDHRDEADRDWWTTAEGAPAYLKEKEASRASA